MTKRYKKTLFTITSLFFLISAPILIFYSQGYRFDFTNKKIVKTGGLFLKISPPGANIYIDHNLSNKTNFFFDSAFIDGLTPKSYQIVIKKKDYYDWTKTLLVKEKQVTEAKNILLLPKNINFNPLLQNISSFLPSQNSNDIFLKINQDKDWVIKRFDPQTKKETMVVSQKNLQKIITDEKNKNPLDRQSNIIFSSLTSSPESKTILLKIIVNGQYQYFIIDLNQETSVIPVISFFPSIKMDNIRDISFNDHDSNKIFFLADHKDSISSSTLELNNESEKNLLDSKTGLKNSLFVQNNLNQTVQLISSPLINQDVVTYKLLDNNTIIWLNYDGFLYSGKINTNKIEFPEIMNLKPLSIDANANYKIIARGLSKVFIKENERIYYLSPKEHIFKTIFNAVKKLIFDSNAKKIAIRNKNQIWLFYLEADNEQPQRVAEEKLLLENSSQNIKNLFWIDDSHILFQENNKINVIEIDNRSKPNIVELTNFPNPQILWNRQQKTLFVLSENKLNSCDNILK